MIHIYENDGVTCVETTVVRSDGKGRPVYLYLVDGMLIDTGPQCLEAEIIPFYESHSFELVTLTHSHEDHTGTASWIQENRNVPIYVHPNGVRICRERSPYPEYRQITWGLRKEFKAVPLGDTIRSLHKEWKVIYTPGHAGDHVSLLNEETGRLFTGDLFVSPKTKVIMDSESIPVIMNSIRKLLAYEFDSMFCSHAGYIQDGERLLKQKLENLKELYGDVENQYKKGLSATEINQKLFPKKYPIVGFSKGEWDSLHIITSIISDLEK